MVQEQYTGAPNILQTDKESSAGILIVRNDLAVSMLAHLSNSHCLVCHVEPLDIHIISCYFQYSDSIDKHLDHLERVLNILRGRRILIGVDCNAHSPLWFCEQRQYTGRGPDTEYRRQRMEGFVFGRGLYLHNVEGQPSTFAGPSGESNIDLTLSTRNLGVANWRVHDGISSSDHRLITCRVSSAVESAARAQPAEEPVRFRDRGVDWDKFECTIQSRIGRIPWGTPAAVVAERFTDAVVTSARECLGERKPRVYNGYEWWNGELDTLRRTAARKKKQRWRYRVVMREARELYFKNIAESGNQNPWGIAYRAASGRCLAPRNVVNGLSLAEGYACDTRGAMSGVLRALCPDDDPGRDTEYHVLVRLAAAMVPSGRDVDPLVGTELGGIVRSLPTTAPGLDGISSRIVKHVWKAVQPEFVRLYDRCVIEGVFPGVWKSGRLLVLPKGNGRPATDPKAYRPITLLSVLGKILERILLKLATGLTSNLSTYQHGFLAGRSTSTALNFILGVARESECKYVQCIFLDISGAFDNAWWPMLMTKAKRGRLPSNLYSLY
ncbi:Retrovirus-related Pol polyprotein from type-1 retrotransposable element R1 [Eumeta japonica]|uniref:Retrovirus-related Pol polyprotein from type-1 retrotransposable element R1 n=1 Tax=Eumeta variegata TaxID=151549 RepID=A0A4C1XPW1_EUMVA|nr:Retrovirus-related Pol polyprotein from type-1 retrotransposable element R1 [Eumeta japonica]